MASRLQINTLPDPSVATDIKIFQWNANSITARKTELIHYLSTFSNPPQVICIQETHLSSRKEFQLENYNIERRDRINRSKGGVMTLIHKTISYTLLPSISDIEEITIEIRLHQQVIRIVNIYNPPNNDIDLQKYNQMALRPNTILLGDFNAHSTLFGGNITDKLGDTLEKFIDDNNLILLNDRTGTHIKPNGDTTAIDLTIASPNLSMKCNWSVESTSLGSDHYPILINLNEPPITSSYNTHRYIYKRANWQDFKESSKITFSNDLKNEDITTYCSNINRAIINAADHSIPVCHAKNRCRKVPYWNKKCSDAIFNRNKAEKKMKRTKDLQDCIHYRLQKAIAQRTLRIEQYNYWTDYCNSLNNNTNLTSVWRMAKKMTGVNSNTNIPTLNKNNIQHVTDLEKANLIANTIASNSADINYSTAFQQHRINMETKWRADTDTSINLPYIDAINEKFEIHELTAAIKQCNRNSAPGNDDITYQLLKKLPNLALKKLLEFFNYLWEREQIVPEWKESIIIPIPKPGTDKSNPQSYRPIALTSALCKIQERLITTRLTWLLEKNNIINPNQSAYRKHRSTLDHLIRLQDSINKSINTKGTTIAIFFDFSKAFDMLWKNGLIYKMKKHGINGKIINWIEDFLSNRKIRVNVNNTLSDSYTLENGTPQGSVISPILFLLIINDFPSNKTTNISTSLFADDSAIWTSGRNTEHLVKILKPRVEEIVVWCNQWGFKLNENKTTAVIFSNSRKARNKTVNLDINGKTIATAPTAKFLGLTFDQQLTWKPHISNIVDKTKRKINLLRSITGQRWGANKTTLLRIYRTLIRPKIEYGFELFLTASKTTLQKLVTLQNTCLRICTGAMKTTATDILYNECGELPLKLRIQSSLAKYSCKIATSNDNPAKEILQDSWQNHYGKYASGQEPIFTQTHQYHQNNNLEAITVKSEPPWNREDIKTDTSLHTHLRKEDPPHHQYLTALNHIKNYENHLHIYTDASQNTQHLAGAAFYIHEDLYEREIRLPNQTSVHTAEIYAIKAAVDYIYSDSSRHDINLAIFSDSLSAIETISKSNLSSYNTNSISMSIIDTIHLLQENNISTTIIWIPGHVGIRGNEIADKIAKNSVLRTHPTIDLQTTLQDKYHSIDQKIQIEWQNSYKESKTGHHYKLLHPSVNSSIKYSCKNRQQETLITRLRLGKCHLNKYLHEINAHPTGLCQYCNTPETVEHYVLNCQHANIFYNKAITLHQALTDEENQLKIYNRTKELKRKL